MVNSTLSTSARGLISTSLPIYRKLACLCVLSPIMNSSRSGMTWVSLWWWVTGTPLCPPATWWDIKESPALETCLMKPWVPSPSQQSLPWLPLRSSLANDTQGESNRRKYRTQLITLCTVSCESDLRWQHVLYTLSRVSFPDTSGIGRRRVFYFWRR